MPVDVYAEVTSRILAMLDAGAAPWRSPILGQAGTAWPRNLASGKPYRGVNVFLLAMTAFAKGYHSACWLTFNQARAAGGRVRKGERSSLVVFWKTYETTDRATGEPTTVPVLRYYNVFNLDQCDGIEAPDADTNEPLAFTPIERADRIAAGYAGGPAVQHAGGRAFYRPSTDAVTLPEPARFVGTEAYYATLFHELAHSTGHSTRLDRGLDTALAPFGSPDYGREELVAEMAAAFLCGHAGIAPATVENSAAYLAGWIAAIKGDKRLAVVAAGAAQRAADWIIGVRPGSDADGAGQ